MIKKYVVSRDESIYEAWPDVVQTNGGKLICIFSECEHHVDRTNARLALCESVDRGRHWSKKTYLTEKGNNNNYFNCARISRLRDGRIAITCDRIIQGFDKGGPIYLWIGDEEGKNFGEPRVLPFSGIVPDKLVELECGRWLVGTHYKNPETQKLEQYMWYSDDEGETWSDRITVGADSAYNLCEVSFLELSDGAVAAFMRENSATGCDCIKTVSYDSGETWEPISRLAIPGCHRPTAGFLNNGTIMITYRFLQGGDMAYNTQNIFAAFLDENSVRTPERGMQKVRLMPVDYDRHPDGDLGYTGWTQFDDGEIYVVGYIKDDSDKAQIRGYSFTMNDVCLGTER